MMACKDATNVNTQNKPNCGVLIYHEAGHFPHGENIQTKCFIDIFVKFEKPSGVHLNFAHW